MTYHLSSEQYQRGVDYIARVRLEAVQPNTARAISTAWTSGMADMLGQLAGTTLGKVMKDSDARLADLDSPLTPLPCD